MTLQWVWPVLQASFIALTIAVSDPTVVPNTFIPAHLSVLITAADVVGSRRSLSLLASAYEPDGSSEISRVPPRPGFLATCFRSAVAAAWVFKRIRSVHNCLKASFCLQTGKDFTTHLQMDAWYRKYGPVYKLFFGKQPIVVITGRDEPVHQVCACFLSQYDLYRMLQACSPCFQPKLCKLVLVLQIQIS